MLEKLIKQSYSASMHYGDIPGFGTNNTPSEGNLPTPSFVQEGGMLSPQQPVFLPDTAPEYIINQTDFVDYNTELGKQPNSNITAAWRLGHIAQRDQLKLEAGITGVPLKSPEPDIDLAIKLRYMRGIEAGQRGFVPQYGKTAWNVWSDTINGKMSPADTVGIIVIPWDETTHPNLHQLASPLKREAAVKNLRQRYLIYPQD